MFSIVIVGLNLNQSFSILFNYWAYHLIKTNLIKSVLFFHGWNTGYLIGLFHVLRFAPFKLWLIVFIGYLFYWGILVSSYDTDVHIFRMIYCWKWSRCIFFIFIFLSKWKRKRAMQHSTRRNTYWLLQHLYSKFNK